MRPDPVLVITGPPGAGKTTTARWLAAGRKRAAHIESDRFFHFIESGYIEPWRPESHEQNVAVMRVVAQAAAGYAGAGYFTVVEGIVSPDWFLPLVRDQLRDLGHRVAYAVLRPTLPVCLARAAARTDDPLSDRKVIEQLWHDFDDLGNLEAHVIERDDGSAEETAHELARRLSDGSLII